MKHRPRQIPSAPKQRAAPAAPQPRFERALALHQAGRLADANALYEEILGGEPTHFDALHLSGVIAYRSGDAVRAVERIERALAVRTDHAEAHSNRANALRDVGRFEDAVASCDRALALRPDLAAAWSNRGNALRDLRRFEAALQSPDAAIALAPDSADAHMNRANVLQDLQHGEAARQALETAIAMRPHHAGAHSNLGNTLRMLRWLDASLVHIDAPIALQPNLAEAHRNRGDTLRELKRFDEALQSYERARALQPGWHFLDGMWLHTKSSLCDWSRLDAALAHLCDAGTMAADFIDYFVADPVAFSVEGRPHFTEKIVYLPDSYQVNDARRRIAEHAPSRAELGLPESGFVFCCFNNHYKILPATFAGWMRILQRVDGSALWLLADNDSAARNLRAAAAAHGVEPGRIVFAPRVPLEDHLARHRAADLFLDTLPYNAHTTASDALWAGLPVLTCAGAAFAGRVAASLLHATGCADLVASSQPEFESRAVALANDPPALAAIRARLAAQRATAPLFDARRFARHLEAAYLQIDARLRAGLPPDDIHLEAAPAAPRNPTVPA